MKKIIRLTENDLTRLVKKIIKEDVDIFYRRRFGMFEKYLDTAISETTHNEFDAEDYKDYKGEIEWRTLAMYEDENGEVDDVEGFFEFSKHFTNKIRKGYAKYMKSK
jgi:hypothetical protein